MAWVITQEGGAVNLDRMAELWFEDGTGRDWGPVAILHAAEPGVLEDVGGDDRVMAVIHELCVVRGDSDNAAALLRALLEAAHNQAVVRIRDVVKSAGFELWHRMDHHP